MEAETDEELARRLQAEEDAAAALLRRQRQHQRLPGDDDDDAHAVATRPPVAAAASHAAVSHRDDEGWRVKRSRPPAEQPRHNTSEWAVGGGRQQQQDWSRRGGGGAGGGAGRGIALQKELADLVRGGGSSWRGQRGRASRPSRLSRPRHRYKRKKEESEEEDEDDDDDNDDDEEEEEEEQRDEKLEKEDEEDDEEDEVSLRLKRRLQQSRRQRLRQQEQKAGVERKDEDEDAEEERRDSEEDERLERQFFNRLPRKQEPRQATTQERRRIVDDVMRATNSYMLQINRIAPLLHRPRHSAAAASSSSSASALLPPPALLTGGQLKPYQSEGVAWLLSLYRLRLSGAILADEMGLGKTIQSIAFICQLAAEAERQQGGAAAAAAALSERSPCGGPHLVVVPLSTIGAWEEAIRKWAPSLSLLVHQGSKEERREKLRNVKWRKEKPAAPSSSSSSSSTSAAAAPAPASALSSLPPPHRKPTAADRKKWQHADVITLDDDSSGLSLPTAGSTTSRSPSFSASRSPSPAASSSSSPAGRQYGFDVLLTSYEVCMKDAYSLTLLPFNLLVVDEAHRIRNPDTKLSFILSSFRCRFKLLLTGTPLQNAVGELLALLRFINPQLFDSGLEQLAVFFSKPFRADDEDEEGRMEAAERTRIVSRLHDVIRPFMLRRVKADVLRGELTQRREVVLYCFLESDSRVLTNWGLLFLEHIEAHQTAGTELLFGCYAQRSKTLLYRKGRLVFPEQPPTALVDFTSDGEAARWAEGSGDYETQGVPEDSPRSSHVSLRVTPEHDMFVQLGNGPHHKMQAQDLLSDDARACVRMLACAQAGYAPQHTSRRREVQHDDLHLDDTQFAAFIELLGFWLGYGSISYHPAATSGYVTFSQVKKKDMTWLRKAFKRAGLTADDWTTRRSVRPQTTLSIKKPAWVAFFVKEFGDKDVRRRLQRRTAASSATAVSPGSRLSSSSASPARRSSLSLSAATAEPATPRSGAGERLSSVSFSFSSSSSYSYGIASEDVEVTVSAAEVDMELVLNADEDEDEEATKSVKWLPVWTLQELSKDEMRLLIRGLHRADGSFADAKTAIYTSSARFRDQLMQALLHCGYSAYAGLMHSKGAIRGYNFHDRTKDTKTYTVSDFNKLSAGEQLKYRPIQATADGWEVSWAEVVDGRNSVSAAACCWPSLSRQRCVKSVPYNRARDGRAWCVEVEHADHLIIAQRAHRGADGVTVTKQSRPIVVGNCPMSGWQSAIYSAIQLNAKLAFLQDKLGVDAAQQHWQPTVKIRSFNNVLMQLRKTVNHPYLFYCSPASFSSSVPQRSDAYPLDAELIRCSGKLCVLHSLVLKLRAAGHQLLVFSQFTSVLDILCDWAELVGHRYLRLDGNTKAAERPALVAQFNAPSSPYPLFFLSTRAGGLGLNLPAASTVIIFDSDWNPQADEQAAGRAHRIGQSRDVQVCRLMVAGGVEERIWERQREKLRTFRGVVDAGSFTTGRKEGEKERLSLIAQVLLQPTPGLQDADADDDGSHRRSSRKRVGFVVEVDGTERKESREDEQAAVDVEAEAELEEEERYAGCGRRFNALVARDAVELQLFNTMDREFITRARAAAGKGGKATPDAKQERAERKQPPAREEVDVESFSGDGNEAGHRRSARAKQQPPAAAATSRRETQQPSRAKSRKQQAAESEDDEEAELLFSPLSSASAQQQQQQYQRPFDVQAEQAVPPWLAGDALGVDAAMLREAEGGAGSSFGLLSDMMEEELQQTGRGGRTLRSREGRTQQRLAGDGMDLILNIDKRKKRRRQQREEEDEDDAQQSGSGGDDWEQALFCPFCDAVCSSERDIERHVNRDCPACPRDDSREEKRREEVID